MYNDASDLTELATLWRRFIAFIIDGIILGGIILFLIIASRQDILFHFDTEEALRAYYMKILIEYFIYTIIVVLIFSVFYTSLWMGTIGKRIAGIYVVDASGRKLSYYKAFLRLGLPVFLAFFLLVMISEAKYKDYRDYNSEFIDIFRDVMPKTYDIYKKQNKNQDARFNNSRFRSFIYRHGLILSVEAPIDSNMDTDKKEVISFIEEYSNLDPIKKQLLASRIFSKKK